jgi:hypothetical protein
MKLKLDSKTKQAQNAHCATSSSLHSDITYMKISAKTLAATSKSNLAVSAAPSKTKPAVKVKAGKAQSKPAKKAVKPVISQAIALLSGERGLCARLVQVVTTPDSVHITALQDNKGLRFANGVACEIKGGKLVGEKEGRIALGGYVNGRNTGAKVELLTPAEFAKRAKPALVHWSADDNGAHGVYIGNPNVKGMCAVMVPYKGGPYYWQMELDSNPGNKHERGNLEPLTKNGKLTVCA